MATPTQRIYTKPFCNSGNKVTIPTDEPVTLEVNQETGYTPPYSQELGGLYIEREAFNGIIHATQQQTLINAQGIDDINTKLETDYVSINDNKIINGSKTFTNAITCNGTITSLKHLTTLEKVNQLVKVTDDKVTTNTQAIANINNQLTTKVSLNGAETISGIKTFTEVPQCSVNATKNNDLVNWQTLQAQITANAGKIELKGTRTTTGVWTLTGLIPAKPLIITFATDTALRWATITTVPNSTLVQNPHYIVLGAASDADDASDIALIIPTASSVAITVQKISSGFTLQAFQ